MKKLLFGLMLLAGCSDDYGCYVRNDNSLGQVINLGGQVFKCTIVCATFSIKSQQPICTEAHHGWVKQ